MTDPTFCDIWTMSKILGVSVSQVRRLIKQGLPCYQPILRGALMFSPEDVKAWVKNHKKAR